MEKENEFPPFLVASGKPDRARKTDRTSISAASEVEGRGCLVEFARTMRQPIRPALFLTVLSLATATGKWNYLTVD